MDTANKIYIPPLNTSKHFSGMNEDKHDKRDVTHAGSSTSECASLITLDYKSKNGTVVMCWLIEGY